MSTDEKYEELMRPIIMAFHNTPPTVSDKIKPVILICEPGNHILEHALYIKCMERGFTMLSPADASTQGIIPDNVDSFIVKETADHMHYLKSMHDFKLEVKECEDFYTERQPRRHHKESYIPKQGTPRQHTNRKKKKRRK